MAIDERETVSLIGSDKVEGTAVYDTDDQKIGTITRLMIDKRSGQVAYAVVGFGGFLGIGDDYYPLPWHSLSYDADLGGYMTTITVGQLKGAPKFDEESKWDWSDPTHSRAVNDYYPIEGSRQDGPPG